MTNPIVSVVIPTYNNEAFLPSCLKALKRQSYKSIEIIVVDDFSKDASASIAKKFGARIFLYGPDQTKGRIFGAPYQRNFGVKKTKGKYVYYADSDYIPSRRVIESCVNKISEGYDAVIIPLDSVGKGFWAACKKLERRAYWEDDNVESPRFIKKSVWNKLGGLNDKLGADDWDIYDRLKQKGYKTGRVKEIVLHNEGSLDISKIIRKSFLYGKSIRLYVTTQPKQSTRHFFPLRVGYIKHWRLFVKDPVHTLGVIIIRTLEYFAGFLGLVSGVISTPKIELVRRQK